MVMDVACIFSAFSPIGGEGTGVEETLIYTPIKMIQRLIWLNFIVSY